MKNQAITRIVKLNIREDKRLDFIKIFNHSKDLIVAQKDCTDVCLLQDKDNPNIFFTYSHWKSEAGLNQYKNTAFFQSTWQEVKTLFADKPQAWTNYELAQAKTKLDYVHFGNANSLLSKYLNDKSYTAIFILVDENTKQHCLPLIQNNEHLKNATIIEIESGEENKNLATCEKIWQQMIKAKANRNTLCINLGGGVIGDMGGFCASCYKRGIDFIQIPTSLLAQVDASVGGKLGIDFMGLKNVIGHFEHPKAVLVDANFLQTLPFEQLRSGFAEMLKHALIFQKITWRQLYKLNLETVKIHDWEFFIEESVKIKAKIVDEDPLEKGIRKALNLGHTIGHAVETYFLNSGNLILHGEAVAYGIKTEAYIAKENKLLSKEIYEEIITTIDSFYPKIHVPEKALEAIIEHTFNDKKNESDEINASLLGDFGKPLINQKITAEEIKLAILNFNKQV